MWRAHFFTVLTYFLAVTAGQAQTVPETVPAGTRLRARVETTLSTKTARTGDGVESILIEPVKVSGHVVLPKGTYFAGRVEAVRAGERKSKALAMLRIAFDKATLPDGRVIGAHASIQSLGMLMDVDSEGAVTEHRESKGEKAVADIGTTAAGAGIGAAAGGGKGAAIGAGVGGGIAALGELADALTKYEDFELKKGRKLWLRLDEDLVLTPAK
jgi:hypothetical protein